MSNSAQTRKEFQITVMLVTVTSLFIVLRFPGLILFLLETLEIDIKAGNWQVLLAMLIVVNHSVNFFIYLIFLESLRKTFIEMSMNLFCFCPRTLTTRNSTRFQMREVQIQKVDNDNAIPCSSIEARENALKVFTIETEN